jgi:hypothetical protein
MIYDNPIHAMREREAANAKLTPEQTPQPVILVSSRDPQDQFAEMRPPGDAPKLIRAAQANGWAVWVRWSLLAVPAGWLQSTRHRPVKEGHLMYVCGVRLAAHNIRAYGCWSIPGGFRSGGLRTLSEARTIGCEELISYIGG